MNIELYIGDRLCDIGNPEDLGIYLKRVFIKPAELSVKDAQKSYEISLPATPVNNEIFSYTNVEEVQGKFKVYDKALLYIDGILIMDGKFRMSQITKDAYIGNLGVPAVKTVKDIFGETTMNQAREWKIPFKGIDTITEFNTDTYDKKQYGDIAPCIFPFALYGLLPKISAVGYTANKNTIDEYVRFGFNNIPPSLNCIQMLQRLFGSADYKLTGSAINDERLKQLYVSYKNPNESDMKWNSGKMELHGKWTNYNKPTRKFEERVNISDDSVYNTDLLNASNSTITKNTDLGGNIVQQIKDNITTFIIPENGLYKIVLIGNLHLSKDNYNKPYRSNNYQVIEPVPKRSGKNYSDLDRMRFELKVLRNVGDDMDSLKFDNVFFRDNQKIESDSVGAYYPKPGNTHFIDPKQNNKILCGFSWGLGQNVQESKNKADKENLNCNPMAISGGTSWDTSLTNRSFSASVSSYVEKTEDGFKPSDKFKVDILNAPESYTEITKYDNKKLDANGQISQIVWLDAKDKLTVVSTSSTTKVVSHLDIYSGWPRHDIDFTLSVEPFMREREWLTITEEGSSDPKKPTMNWDDEPTVNKGEINLAEFMPKDIKINEWVDNFCKAFNLDLIYKGDKNFEMNIRKHKINFGQSAIIDLDKQTDIKQRQNESLKLPYVYELGYTIDSEEEGYYQTMAKSKNGEKIVNSVEDGSGKFYTGSYETNKLTQNSNFSYNWYKELTDKSTGKIIEVPVISTHEIWDEKASYEEMKDKTFYDKTQRFWYKSGIYNAKMTNDREVSLALVSNEYEDSLKQKIVLDYKDTPNSIAKNYFLLLTNNNNDYTVVECYLTAQEYTDLDKSLIKLNGDLYYPAEVDGYDPLNRKKCKLKLIRKII